MSTIRRPLFFEFSAGGIVLDSEKILLIKTHNLAGKEVYTFPKGKIEKKETSAQTAQREIYEETGIKALPEKKLGDTRYLYMRDSLMVIKKVVWYSMRLESNLGSPEKGMIPEWHEISQAATLLSYSSEKLLLKKYFS